MQDLIYLDYNATTPIDSEVLRAMLPYLKGNFGNPSSIYSIGVEAKQAIEKARVQVAELINAAAGEVVFTSGGTEANNMAIIGTALANENKGKHIITSAIEHPAVINVCQYLEMQGWEVTYVPVNKYGRVEMSEVEKAIRPDTVLVTIMHANNEVGTIQPIEEIGAIASKHNIIFHTDAAQSLGKVKTDVKSQSVDLLSIAGHKLYAPKGIGALYIKGGVQLKNVLWGAGQEKGIRPGTENVPYIVGLGQACYIAQQNLNRNATHMMHLKMRLWEGLRTKLNDTISINGQLDNSLPNTLSVSLDGIKAHQLASSLSLSLAISTGSACHADTVHISPVLKAMQVEERKALSTIRISVGKDTTEDEVDRAIAIIAQTVYQLRQ